MLHQKSEFTLERYLFAQISQKSEFKYKIVEALRLQFVHGNQNSNTKIIEAFGSQFVHRNRNSNTKIVEALRLQFLHENQDSDIRIVEALDLLVVHHTGSSTKKSEISRHPEFQQNYSSTSRIRT
jgi:hypothetical protein